MRAFTTRRLFGVLKIFRTERGVVIHAFALVIYIGKKASPSP